ncbi:hypothetical protein ACS0TY_007045 [Phlomoides rotata]
MFQMLMYKRNALAKEGAIHVPMQLLFGGVHLHRGWWRIRGSILYKIKEIIFLCFHVSFFTLSKKGKA